MLQITNIPRLTYIPGNSTKNNKNIFYTLGNTSSLVTQNINEPSVSICKKSLESYPVVAVKSINRHPNLFISTKYDSYILLKHQYLLEQHIRNGNQEAMQKIVDSLKNKDQYSSILEGILNNYIIQNNVQTLETLCFQYGVFTKNTLNFLLHQQLLNDRINIYCIKILIARGAVFTVDNIETVLKFCNNKAKVIQTLIDVDLLNIILDDAIDQKKIDFIHEMYFSYNVTTNKALNYMLLHNLQNNINRTLIDQLITAGAMLPEDVSNALLDSNNLVIARVLMDTFIKKNNLKNVNLLYFQRNIITQPALDYILAHETNPIKRYYAELLFENEYHYKSSLSIICGGL